MWIGFVCLSCSDRDVSIKRSSLKYLGVFGFSMESQSQLGTVLLSGIMMRSQRFGCGFTSSTHPAAMFAAGVSISK